MATLVRLLRTVDRSEGNQVCDLKGYVDTLYDYIGFLTKNRTTGVNPAGKVAIIGAGAAGMVAAYNLMQAGIVPDVFEAGGRIGGRTASVPFPSNPQAFAELGAMRIPCGEEIFWHYYRDVFKLPATPPFPNPGAVNTLIYFQNQVYEWEAGKKPPAPFAQINEDWNNFLTPISDAIFTPWLAGDLATVRAVWQRYVDRWKDMSFYRAVADGIPQWGTAELTMFGSLGVGSGGFGPFYQVNFLEILRLVFNRLETELKQIPLGVTHFTQQFATFDGQEANLRLRSPVTRLTRFTKGPQAGKIQLDYVDNSGPTPKPATAGPYDAVIVATTTGAMEYLGLTLPQPPASGGAPIVNVVAEPVKNAIRELNIERSSKLFILTKDKFWKKLKGRWANIQTDELFFGLYTLDYPQIDEGVVLMSYTWANDSTRLESLDPEERFARFKAIVARINPEFAQHLVPVTPRDILKAEWQLAPYYHGAFKLNYPGQEPACHAAYFQFQTVLDPKQDTGVYLAGDSVSWSGGWIEGALQTGVNAATAVLKRLGGKFSVPSPLDQNPKLFRY